MSFTDWDFRSLFAAVVGYAIILGVLGSLMAVFGRRRKWLFVSVPILLWALFIGIPFLSPPILSPTQVAPVAGVLCVAIGAALTTVAARARRALRAAGHRDAITTSEAMSALNRGDGVQVTLRGSIEADPPLVAPMSGVPCLSYRVELFRQGDGGEELIGLEEASCDRVVLADGSGRVALSVDPRALRAAGAPVNETAASGTLGSTSDDTRLKRAARHLDREGSMQGAYRAVERTVQHGAQMTAIGRMVRRAGEPMLVPTMAARVSVRFGGEATRGYRRLMFASAALAALAVGAGFALIATPREPPPEADGP